MALFFSVSGALILGYLIPVLASLYFSLIVGRVSPAALSQGGRIKAGFVVMHGLVWALASAVSGFAMAKMVPDARLRMVACAVAGLLLVAALFSNMEEMKKRQSPLQIGGMVLATMVGITAGLQIFLKMAKNV